MGKTLVVVVVVVLCMMPVRMAIIDLEAILEAVDAVAISIVTLIHLQMLGLWWEETLEAEALAPVMVKGAWLNYQIELPVRVLAAAAAFCGQRFQLLLETELSRRGEPRQGQGSHRLQHLLPQQNTVPVARLLQTRYVLGTSRVSQLFL